MSWYRALGSTSAATAVNLALSLGSSVIVARLLTPDEIGVFSISVSLLAFAHILRDFGVGQYLIQLRDVQSEDVRAGFTVMLCTSMTLALLMVLLAPWAASFYAEPRMTAVFHVLALNFALIPFGAQILSVMKRELAFGSVALINITASAVQAAATVAFAYGGQKHLSMAWGSLAGNVVMIACLFAARPHYAFLRPRFSGLSKILRFGSQSSLSGIVGRIGSSGPDLVLGKTLGMEAVAQFSRANSLLAMFAWKVDEILLQVFGPVFAKGLREGGDARANLRQALQTYSLVQFAILAVLALVGPTLITMLFGPQWEAAAQLSTWLTLWSVIVVPIQLAPAALMAAGHVGTCLRANLVSNVALVAVLFSSAIASLEQMAWLFIVYRVINLWAWLQPLRRHFDFTAMQCWQACRGSLGICTLGVAPGAAAETYLRNSGAALPALAHVVALGAVSVLGIMLALQFSTHPLRAEMHKAFRLVAHRFASH